MFDCPFDDDDADAQLLTTGEVRARLLTDPRLRGVAATCALPAVRVGREWRIRRTDLEAWIAAYAARALPSARVRVH